MVVNKTQPLPPIVLFGNEALSSCRRYQQAPILSQLMTDGWPVEAVIIKAKPTRSRQWRQWPIMTVAQKARLPIHQVADRDQLTRLIKTASFQSQLAVVVSFGLFFSKTVLDYFPRGMINVHPSLLPQDRGASPIESAILNNHSTTGVSLMGIVQSIDAGPIYAQESIAIKQPITKQALTDQLGQLAARMLADKLRLIYQGQITARRQDHHLASLSPTITKTSGRVNWASPATTIERQIRAYLDWPASYTTLQDQVVSLTAARVLTGTKEPIGAYHFDALSQTIIVNCQKGRLAIERLKPANRPEITALDFSNGYL